MLKKTLILGAALVALSLPSAEAGMPDFCVDYIRMEIECNREQSSNARAAYSQARRLYSQVKRAARRGDKLPGYYVEYYNVCKRECCVNEGNIRLDVPKDLERPPCLDFERSGAKKGSEADYALSYLKCMQSYLRSETSRLRSESRSLRTELRDAIRNGCEELELELDEPNPDDV